MHWSKTRRSDEGSASLEFLSAGVLLLVPLVYLVVTLAALQSAAYATSAAASTAARMLSRSAEDDPGRLQSAVDLTVGDFGLEPGSVGLDVQCSPAPDCRETGGVVTVTARIEVDLPLLPPWVASVLPIAVPVASSAAQPVTRFPGAG